MVILVMEVVLVLEEVVVVDVVVDIVEGVDRSGDIGSRGGCSAGRDCCS